MYIIYLWLYCKPGMASVVIVQFDRNSVDLLTNLLQSRRFIRGGILRGFAKTEEFKDLGATDRDVGRVVWVEGKLRDRDRGLGNLEGDAF